MILVLGLILLIGGLGTGVLLLVGRKPEPQQVMPIGVDDQIFSADTYRPMLTLLDNADFKFLRSQPGHRPEVEASLRRQRYDLFLAYLLRMETDFARASFALKSIMAASSQDRPDLASALVRAQFSFAYRTRLSKVQAFLWSKGLVTVDTSRLTDLVQIYTVMPQVIAGCASA